MALSGGFHPVVQLECTFLNVPFFLLDWCCSATLIKSAAPPKAAATIRASCPVNISTRLPARLALDDRALLAEWKLSYQRGQAMQAPVAPMVRGTLSTFKLTHYPAN